MSALERCLRIKGPVSTVLWPLDRSSMFANAITSHGTGFAEANMCVKPSFRPIPFR